MNERTDSVFGVLLREKLAELDADEVATAELADDPVERLRLDAQRVVQADHHGPLPRAGHQAYAVPAAPAAAEPGQRHLNILH